MSVQRDVQWIVLIEDEQAICDLFQTYFELNGLALHTATEPEAGLLFIRDHDVSVVLCDYRMPSMTGLQVLERLEEPLPFYLMSGEIGLEERFGKDARISGILNKPVDLPEVERLVRTHLV